LKLASKLNANLTSISSNKNDKLQIRQTEKQFLKKLIKFHSGNKDNLLINLNFLINLTPDMT